MHQCFYLLTVKNSSSEFTFKYKYINKEEPIGVTVNKYENFLTDENVSFSIKLKKMHCMNSQSIIVLGPSKYPPSPEMFVILLVLTEFKSSCSADSTGRKDRLALRG